ncbi:MAG: ABC transporter ATP-binding protein [Patescibacteria group bacterium]
MIQLKNISKIFSSGKSKIAVVDDVNLEIKEGEFMALVGRSGSGKTTLLNLLGGLDSPTKGDIFINGKNISHSKDKELSEYRNKNIGFIFQEFHLQPFLTVKDNILLPTFFNSDDKNRVEYAKELIKEVELEGKTNSLVNELSGGQKQRVAIARALINKPKIIIADEPTGNLDEKTGETIIKLLKKLHKEHKITFVIATHDEKIASAAEKIIHIENGKIHHK